MPPKRQRTELKQDEMVSGAYRFLFSHIFNQTEKNQLLIKIAGFYLMMSLIVQQNKKAGMIHMCLSQLHQ